PCERKLPRRHSLLASNFVYSLNQLEILREALASEPRRVAAVIISGEIIEALDLTRQESAAERTVGNKANPKLANRLEDLIFRIAAPQRILGLKRADRMHRVRSSDRFRSRLAQAEVSHLARLNQLRHCADGIFDRNARIDTMLIIEIDTIDAESSKRRIASFAHVFGTAVNRAFRRITGVAANGELRRDDHLFASCSKRLSKQLLILVRTVCIGRIEEVDAKLERAVKRSERFGFIGRSVELRHSHAPETLLGNLQALRSQFAFLHVFSSCA